MKYIRIKSYYPSGEFTNCEHLYLGDNQLEAIARFRKAYPEHKDCVVVAEDYDSEEHKDHFSVCARCGCVHY